MNIKTIGKINTEIAFRLTPKSNIQYCISAINLVLPAYLTKYPKNKYPDKALNAINKYTLDATEQNKDKCKKAAYAAYNSVVNEEDYLCFAAYAVGYVAFYASSLHASYVSTCIRSVYFATEENQDKLLTIFKHGYSLLLEEGKEVPMLSEFIKNTTIRDKLHSLLE